VSRRHIAWGFLARDNDSIKADSPFVYGTFFIAMSAYTILKDRLTVIRSLSAGEYHENRTGGGLGLSFNYPLNLLTE
jgi:hypothetical protein